MILNLEVLSWIVAFGVALAAGALSTLVGGVAAQVISSLKRTRRIGRLYRLGRRREKKFDLERELDGGINWLLLGGGAGWALMVGVYLLMPQMPFYALFAAMLGFGGVLFARKSVRERNEWRINSQISEFLSSLRLSLAMKPTISLALQRTAERMGEGIFAARLRHHTDTLLMTEGAMSVIEALRRDFSSRALEDLLIRLQAARQGGLSLPEALRQASGEMELEMRREAEFAVEDAPTRLTFPMLATLFPPLVMILLLPMLLRLMKTIGELK